MRKIGLAKRGMVMAGKADAASHPDLLLVSLFYLFHSITKHLSLAVSSISAICFSIFSITRPASA